MIKIRPKGTLIKGALAIGVAGALSSGILIQHVVAAQPNPPADAVAHALGLDDPGTTLRIQMAQQRRQLSYRYALVGCVRAAGFVGAPNAQLAAPTPGLRAAGGDQPGLAGGFGVTTAPPSTATPSDPLMQYVVTLSSAEQNRFGDVMAGPNGCDSRATQQAMGTLLSAGDAYDKLESAMYSTLANKPAVKAAGLAWFACMGSPSAFSNPSQIPQYLLNKRDSTPIGDAGSLQALNAEEMRLAAADVHCRQTVVDPVFQPLLREARTQMVTDHPAELSAFRLALVS